MATFTFTDLAIELEDIQTGCDGRVYGEPCTTVRRGKPGHIGHKAVTTPFIVCKDLYDGLHDADGTQIEGISVRVTFDLTFDHEPETRGSYSGDSPAFDSRAVTVTEVEFLDCRDGVYGESYDGESDVAAAIHALFVETLESHEPQDSEADHPRI